MLSSSERSITLSHTKIKPILSMLAQSSTPRYHILSLSLINRRVDTFSNSDYGSAIYSEHDAIHATVRDIRAKPK